MKEHLSPLRPMKIRVKVKMNSASVALQRRKGPSTFINLYYINLYIKLLLIFYFLIVKILI